MLATGACPKINNIFLPIAEEGGQTVMVLHDALQSRMDKGCGGLKVLKLDLMSARIPNAVWFLREGAVGDISKVRLARGGVV